VTIDDAESTTVGGEPATVDDTESTTVGGEPAMVGDVGGAMMTGEGAGESVYLDPVVPTVGAN
jgi:hypothetical protein